MDCNPPLIIVFLALEAIKAQTKAFCWTPVHVTIIQRPWCLVLLVAKVHKFVMEFPEAPSWLSGPTLLTRQWLINNINKPPWIMFTGQFLLFLKCHKLLYIKHYTCSSCKNKMFLILSTTYWFKSGNCRSWSIWCCIHLHNIVRTPCYFVPLMWKIPKTI